MLITKDGNVVTLINVFETKPEKQQELIDAWIRFTEEVKEEPGFIGAALHKSTDGARVINYAHWRSEADFGSFLNKHGEQFAQLGRYATRMDPTPTKWSISMNGQTVDWLKQLRYQDVRTTLLSGPLLDQVALLGMLLQIIRLGYTLHSLETSKAIGCEEAPEQ
jgi:heme-degrading monooxygenase HmoA